MLRADVYNAVEELGQLLDHNGAIGEASATPRASSTLAIVTRDQRHQHVHKMVWHHTVAPGDVVVVDLLCHKSILHIAAGAIPVFLS